MTPEEFAAALTEKFSGEEYKYARANFGVKRGPKYTRITQGDEHDPYQSVHCFVDDLGQVFKPAGWDRPAKGVRYATMEEALAASDPYGGYLYVRR